MAMPPCEIASAPAPEGARVHGDDGLMGGGGDDSRRACDGSVGERHGLSPRGPSGASASGAATTTGGPATTSAASAKASRVEGARAVEGVGLKGGGDSTRGQEGPRRAGRWR